MSFVVICDNAFKEKTLNSTTIARKNHLAFVKVHFKLGNISLSSVFLKYCIGFMHLSKYVKCNSMTSIVGNYLKLTCEASGRFPKRVEKKSGVDERDVAADFPNHPVFIGFKILEKFQNINMVIKLVQHM